MTCQQRLHREGCDLAFRVEGHGPPVVFIQGVGVHGSGWRPQVRGLARDFECLTFDNRGIGLSDAKPGALTVEQMARDAMALMDAQRWPSAHLVGHSLGGLIALCLAMEAPEKVRSLSLLCTFARGDEATRLSMWMLWTGLRTRIGTRRQRRNAFLQLVLSPAELAAADKDAIARDLANLFGHDLADQPAVVMRQMNAMRRYDATPRLGELGGVPTLVVSARHDRIARPELGRAMAQGIPGARFVELADASHGAPIQYADRVNALLVEHLAAAAPSY